MCLCFECELVLILTRMDADDDKSRCQQSQPLGHCQGHEERGDRFIMYLYLSLIPMHSEAHESFHSSSRYQQGSDPVR